MGRFYAKTPSFYIADSSSTGFWHLHSLGPVPGESQKQLYLQLSGFSVSPPECLQNSGTAFIYLVNSMCNPASLPASLRD